MRRKKAVIWILITLFVLALIFPVLLLTAGSFMGTEEFRNLFKIRNGVETLPSLLRRRYHADRMSVRGLIRGRFFFGCKIGALNFKKLFTYRKGLGHYAQNPVLA